MKIKIPSIILSHCISIPCLFINVLTTLRQLSKILIELGFDEKKHWQCIRFYESLNQDFYCFKKLNMSFSYVLFLSPLIAVQMLNASDINMQFFITCFDVCSSIPHGQSEWLNPGILRSCKNFVDSIFFIHICVIRLFFVFIRPMCHFIFFWFNGSFCVNEYLNNCHW